MRADWNRYKTSCVSERDKNSASLDDLYLHIIIAGIASGELKIPRGWLPDPMEWELVPTACFVLDQSQELSAYLNAIAAGITTRQDVCTELGKGDFEEIANRLAKEEQLLKQLGVTVTIGQPGATTNQPKTGV